MVQKTTETHKGSLNAITNQLHVIVVLISKKPVRNVCLVPVAYEEYYNLSADGASAWPANAISEAK